MSDAVKGVGKLTKTVVDPLDITGAAKKAITPSVPGAPKAPEAIRSARDTETADVEGKRRRAASMRGGRRSLLSGPATGTRDTLG